jgi:hypothetical protein
LLHVRRYALWLVHLPPPPSLFETQPGSKREPYHVIDTPSSPRSPLAGSRHQTQNRQNLHRCTDKTRPDNIILLHHHCALHPSNPPSHRQSETPRADVLRLPSHHPSVLVAPAQSRLASCLPSGAGPRGADLLLPLARGFPIIYSTKFLRPPGASFLFLFPSSVPSLSPRLLLSLPLPLLFAPPNALLLPLPRPSPTWGAPGGQYAGPGETPTPSVERAARGAPHGAT